VRAARVVAIVIGALFALIGLALIVPGAFLAWAYGTQRDSSGYFDTARRMVTTTGYALAAPDVNVEIGSGMLQTRRAAVTAVRIRAVTTADVPLFVGIGPADLVAQYLSGVAHDDLSNFGWGSGAVKYRHVQGQASKSPPGDQAFWVARQEGIGGQTLEWNVQDGTWTAVIMNADGSAPVTVDVSLGARLDVLLPIAIGLLVGGVLLAGLGAVLIALGARHLRYPKNRYPGRGPAATPWIDRQRHPVDPAEGYPPARPAARRTESPEEPPSPPS
jgi:hypothetical protein